MSVVRVPTKGSAVKNVGKYISEAGLVLNFKAGSRQSAHAMQLRSVAPVQASAQKSLASFNGLKSSAARPYTVAQARDASASFFSAVAAQASRPVSHC